MALMTKSSASFNFSDFKTSVRRERCAGAKRFVKHQVHRRARREEHRVIRDQMEVLEVEREVKRLLCSTNLQLAFFVDGKFKHLNPTEAEILHEIEIEEMAHLDHDLKQFNDEFFADMFTYDEHDFYDPRDDYF